MIVRRDPAGDEPGSPGRDKTRKKSGREDGGEDVGEAGADALGGGGGGYLAARVSHNFGPRQGRGGGEAFE